MLGLYDHLCLLRERLENSEQVDEVEISNQQNQADALDLIRVNGCFVDAEGNIPEGF